MSERMAWTRQELILAINLYCRTPFGKIHNRNPDIIGLAAKIERSPNSISYKLANFASLDPSLPRKGASHTSKLDRLVWSEFFSNWEAMAFESEKLFANLDNTGLLDDSARSDSSLLVHEEGKTKEYMLKTRVNQSFFRKMVLSSYDNACCITGISMPDLLIASHIVPWSVDKNNRLNPRNGLCLNALHDRAFDYGLITISPDFTVDVSPTLYKQKHHELITNYKDKPIHLPHRFLPDNDFLAYHRDQVFQSH